MSNDANRTLIVIAASAWIVLMAVLIFFTWTADTDVIDRLGDFVEYLDAHNDDAGKLIVTLSALVTVVLALLVIIVEVAPEDEERELRVEQAGATTIVPAGALRQRLEEALAAVPEITAAKAKVTTKDKGISAALDITILPGTNVAAVTQEASRVVVDAVQSDLGLPVVGLPTVRIAFASGAQPVASSVAQAPAPPPVTPQDHPEPAPDVETHIDDSTQAPASGGQSPPEPQPSNPWSPPPHSEADPQQRGPWSPQPPPAEGEGEPRDNQP